MSGFRPRTAWTGGLVAATSLAVALTAAPATAVSGPTASDTVSAATARLDAGGQRGCSATLVAAQWLLTAASCFTDTPGGTLTSGAPKLKTTATIGGSAQQVVNLVPRTDRDVVMAQLAKPVSGITPVQLAAAAPAAGDEVQAAGYGRTHDEWVPDHVHAAAFTVQNTAATTLDLAAKSDGAAICKGDTGGPVLSTTGAVVGVSSLSWQGGCLGTDPAETRTGAVAARVDDLASWVQQVAYAPVFAAAPWKHAVQITAGYYAGDSAGGTRHMDLIVVWDDGKVTLYQGGYGNDPARPFAAEHQLQPEKSIWTHAVNVTSVNTGSVTDGVVVRWSDGEMTLYTSVDAKGFHGEKQLAPPHNTEWQDDAQQLTAGRFTANGLRDDLLVTWKDGHVSLFSDLAANGLNKQTQTVAKNTTWTHAQILASGSFTGKATDDLLVRWTDGETTIYPGMTGKGLPGEIRIRPEKSYWTNAAAITVGAFSADTSANDILVRWNDGHVSYFTGVDAKGLHDEIQLAPAG
ncbi:esterase [Streptomyces sp. MUSC 14]|uniref:S1 family peptidase n=1 Tax=Streptomyces sp. MUSC 14 TaxID=1354889 RepID=UPI0008F5A8C1|nr:S1 family peptidase [Streptomyces sp. MUSC 14]OIK01068.1 esterase [Streptomyces sp. MUSC 14]